MKQFSLHLYPLEFIGVCLRGNSSLQKQSGSYCRLAARIAETPVRFKLAAHVMSCLLGTSARKNPEIGFAAVIRSQAASAFFLLALQNNRSSTRRSLADWKNLLIFERVETPICGFNIGKPD
jgi:hypothetical protein